MKLLRKISVGGINGVRGGLKGIKGRVRVMTVAGIARDYKEKTNENMGVSYGFSGEFRAINVDGEECAAPVVYLPEPAQGMLKSQIDAIDGEKSVEFGFHVFAVEDASAIKGYVFELEPLMETRASTALEQLTANLPGFAKVSAAQAQLQHEAAAGKASKGHK